PGAVTILLYPHADAIIGAAETATMPNGSAIPIGNHRNVLSPTGKVVAPAAVFYLRPGGRWTGSLCAPESGGWLPFQFTCIGIDAYQAMFVADRITEALDAVVVDRKSRGYG